MKVNNWRRKLAASLVAGGLLVPSTVGAANLDTNLVVDPGFEDVNTAVTCCPGNGVQLNSWADGSIRGFAYNYGQGYDDGGPLAGGGSYYFLPNADSGQVQTPGKVSQNISVSAGDTGAQIASGEAAVALSGFFTSYLGLDLHGSLDVEFLNSGGTSLGRTTLTAQTPRPWHQERGVGFVPIGTATLRASVFADSRLAYIDNVDVRITNAANELLFVEVNTTTGQVAMKNQTGESFDLDYYKITSAGGTALNAASWNSLQEQNLPGFPGGNGTGNGWEQFGGSSSAVIGESYLTGDSRVSNATSVGLGAAFNPGGAHDLTFTYGVVPAAAPVTGDYNNDGAVDAADYVVWRKGGPLQNEGATPGSNTPDDYDVWRANYGLGDPIETSTLVKGFVRYVSAAATTAVPEPSSVFLVAIGIGALFGAARRE
jgi:PEP-CTERM motif-containing protein